MVSSLRNPPCETQPCWSITQYATPVLGDDGRVYVTVDDGDPKIHRVIAVDPGGELVWSSEQIHGYIGPLVLAKTQAGELRVLVIAEPWKAGALHVLDAATGLAAREAYSCPWDQCWFESDEQYPLLYTAQVDGKPRLYVPGKSWDVDHVFVIEGDFADFGGNAVGKGGFLMAADTVDRVFMVGRGKLSAVNPETLAVIGDADALDSYSGFRLAAITRVPGDGGDVEYVVADRYQSVAFYDMDATLLTALDDPYGDSFAIAPGGDAIFCCANGGIQRINQQGLEVWWSEIGSTPASMVIGGEGRLYSAWGSNNNVWLTVRKTSDGTIVHEQSLDASLGGRLTIGEDNSLVFARDGYNYGKNTLYAFEGSKQADVLVTLVTSGGGEPVPSGTERTLNITVESLGPAQPVDATVTITVEPDGAGALVVDDDLPGPVTCNLATEPGQPSKCNVTGLKIGEPQSFELKQKIDADFDGPVTATVTVTVEGADDPFPANNTRDPVVENVVPGISDSYVDPIVGPDLIPPDGSATYTVTYGNKGNVPAPNTKVSVTLPPNLKYQSGTGTPEVIESGQRRRRCIAVSACPSARAKVESPRTWGKAAGMSGAGCLALGPRPRLLPRGAAERLDEDRGRVDGHASARVAQGQEVEERRQVHRAALPEPARSTRPAMTTGRGTRRRTRCRTPQASPRAKRSRPRTGGGRPRAGRRGPLARQPFAPWPCQHRRPRMSRMTRRGPP